MKKLSVIITNYNELSFVKECLPNLEGIYSRMEVIVKDQGSTDGSVGLIKKGFPRVKLIEGENDGLSKAYNKATKAASGDYFLYLGMDAVPQRDTLSGMVDYFEKNKAVGAATCKLVTKDGSLDMDAHRAFPTPWTALTRLTGLGKLFPHSDLFNHYFLPKGDLEKPHEIDLCISHFMLVRREAFEQIGGFDEDFFLYGEDVDFCYRIKQAGWQIMYLPQWQAKHYKGGSVGIRSTTRKIVKKPLSHRLKMQKLSTQAMRQFMEKHYSGKYPKLLLYMVYTAIFVLGKIRVLVESLRRS
ncbi:MAG: glycosyltransferase family 2 protein [bacterium]